MKKYKSLWEGHFGRIIVANHHIVSNPPKVLPIYFAPYRAGPNQRERKRDEIDKMQKAGVAEPAVLEWASPGVFALKKDGNMRFC